MKNSDAFDPIVPFLFFQHKYAEMIEAIRLLHREAGLRRFILIFPYSNGEAKGERGLDAFERFGDLLSKVRAELAADEIEIGWWCAPTMSIAPLLASGEQPQRMIGIDGEASYAANCPLDERFASSLALFMQTVVRRGAPPYIFLEDDYRMSHQGAVKVGCFCPAHMELFAERIGRQITREELAVIFRTESAQAVQYRKEWAAMMKDTLIGLASRLRRVVDEVAPSTRLALCQPGASDLDGDITEAVAKALAGGNRPLVRLFGSDYSSDRADRLADITFHMLHSKQTLPGDFELIHETDPFPHSRFFFSATKLRALLSLALFYGLEGSLSYVTQYTDGPTEDDGYYRMVGSSRSYFAELRRSVAGYTLAGPRVLYRPLAHVHTPFVGTGVANSVEPAWASVLGKLGIPYTAASGSDVVLVSGTEMRDLADEEMAALFRGGVLLDGTAAAIACQRGFGEALGLKAVPFEPADSERIFSEHMTPLNDWMEHTEGTGMYVFNLALAVQQASLYLLEAVDDKAQVLSEFRDDLGERVAAASILFENRFGGRVAVLAYDLQQNLSASIFNYKRRAQLRGLIEWLGRNPLPVYAAKAPNIMLTAQVNPVSGDMLAAVYNMSLDPLEEVQLVVDKRRDKPVISYLRHDGQWEQLPDIEKHEQDGKVGLHIRKTCLTLQPLILHFTDH
ncbi:hypothetical protein [Paenibacillus sp. GCM10027626]|uniref:hypothetical protein n=1 Tax=Paenibacillus sp. GCM10027626 TaxID=3273411 RepID=UPI0036253815